MDFEFETSLGYRLSPCVKIKIKTKIKIKIKTSAITKILNETKTVFQ